MPVLQKHDFMQSHVATPLHACGIGAQPRSIGCGPEMLKHTVPEGHGLAHDPDGVHAAASTSTSVGESFAASLPLSRSVVVVPPHAASTIAVATQREAKRMKMNLRYRDAVTRALFAAFVLVCACRSRDISGGAPPPASTSSGTTIIRSEMLDAAVPECSVHLVSSTFQTAGTTPAGKLRVDGDYMHTLAKVSVERTGYTWSGTFTGPRDALFDFLRQHVCTAAHVYALQPDGNKDPTKGPVAMSIFEMTPNEHGDVEAICNASSRSPGVGDAGNVDVRDHAMMQWIEDTLTTTKWDAWRKSFARERADLVAKQQDATALFHARGDNLTAAAAALGITPCPVAVEWKKR
jgi:hypothetical protein